MKYLGIDFGKSKIGLALSDEGGSIAFPHSVISNDEHTISSIVTLVADEKVGGIVLGDTRTESGEANEVTDMLEVFKDKIEKSAGIKVELVQEHGTTAAAHADFREGVARNVANPTRTAKDNNLDARAAALILQRFIDAK